MKKKLTKRQNEKLAKKFAKWTKYMDKLVAPKSRAQDCRQYDLWKDWQVAYCRSYGLKVGLGDAKRRKAFFRKYAKQ